jgi:hypothetical protein
MEHALLRRLEMAPIVDWGGFHRISGMAGLFWGILRERWVRHCLSKGSSMFQNRGEHRAFVVVATILCVAGMTAITLSVFLVYTGRAGGYGPFVAAAGGTLLFLMGLGVGRFIKRSMS